MKKKLRSQEWYGKLDKDGFIHRSWMKNQGFPDRSFQNKPVIGICNTWSEFNPCNSHLRTLAEGVKRGVWEAGGFPVEFPVMSLGETQIKPTAMLFRNLLSMDVEESIRGYGMDGVVLLGGCDKTTPAQLMGAFSVDIPTLVVSSGPMLNGKYRGKDIGSGTEVWKFSEAVRSGKMSLDAFLAAENGMSRSSGVCMTMGTASSISCLMEGMGLSLPGNGTLPAVDARRMRLSHESGVRIVEMVESDLTPSKFIKRNHFLNAIIINAAIGGSTNVVLHLLAMAGRIGIDLKLQDFNLGSPVPLLINCMPSGKYLMEDFCYAGGMPALLKELCQLDVFDSQANTVMDQPISSYSDKAEIYNSEVIATLNQPFQKNSGINVLFGNLCPKGAVIKTSAASPHLLNHIGVAYVFSSVEEMKSKINDPDLPVDKDSILVLQGCGPKGYPGMAEVGNMPIPKKLLDQGILDVVRVSDARMSGTAFGTVVLHVTPETYVGGPLAIVRTGDKISLNVKEGRLDLLVSESEFQERSRNWVAPELEFHRGYAKLYIDHVMGAERGADFDFLVGKSSSIVRRESH